MVIPLKLLLDQNYDRTFLEKVLSSFKCEKDNDVESFLINLAEENERKKETITFLSINDEKAEKGEIWVDGYFSLALKVFYFYKTAEQEEKDKICKEIGELTHIPAYLIGQLGRADKSKKGLGGTWRRIVA